MFSISRVGGAEHAGGGPRDGDVHHHDAVYRDIVPDERIVLAYEMRMNRGLISVSVVTVIFAGRARETRLIYTEQGTFLDGIGDVRWREGGTHAHFFDALDAALGSNVVQAMWL